MLNEDIYKMFIENHFSSKALFEFLEKLTFSEKDDPENLSISQVILDYNEVVNKSHRHTGAYTDYVWLFHARESETYYDQDIIKSTSESQDFIILIKSISKSLLS